MTTLPPYVFPPVWWFIKAQKAGKMQVGLGGFYQKQTLRSRYAIAGPNKLQTLSIPVVHTGDKKRLDATEISYAEKWVREHAHSWKSAYGKAPFYEFYDYKLLPVIQQNHILIADLLRASITQLHAVFQMDIPLLFTDEDLYDEEPLQVEPYMQVFDDRFGFRQPVSALDLIFNLGPEAADYIAAQAQLLR